ncbi:porin family protein [Mucilaginibacter segetis]|uniref:PorT family protein n=1 Tax=Mucilaginibacter segetis TaxID=2793071 RepID=A0A934UP52_9SPHI|nr:porin family protein [Mucilaginibacter segetis]MBK0381069.1 PorT family protein [Mucilaginibacter segetis]
MKKFAFTLLIFLATVTISKAQLLPKFQFGAKAGVNLTSLSGNNTFNSDNRAGYLGGFWARFGALGFNFQPEIYVTGKNVRIDDGNGNVNDAKFTSIDVPLLFGGKVGALGFGGRFYTGPLVSFAINKDQNFGSAAGNAVRLNYKDQNFAWQFGAGIDIQKLSIDLRYEAGLTKQGYGSNGDNTRVNLFNLTLGYSLFSL